MAMSGVAEHQALRMRTKVVADGGRAGGVVGDLLYRTACACGYSSGWEMRKKVAEDNLVHHLRQNGVGSAEVIR